MFTITGGLPPRLVLRSKCSFASLLLPPRPVGSVPRCKCVRHMLVASFPGPRGYVEPRGPVETGAQSASSLHRARRRPCSGASSVNFNIVRRTQYFQSVRIRYFQSVIYCCLIDIIVIFGATPSSIQTLAFQHLFRLSRWSSEDEVRKTNIIMNSWSICHRLPSVMKKIPTCR